MNTTGLNYGEIIKIFPRGCIIRAQFLQKITDAYAQNAGIANLLLAPYFKQIADDYQQALRDVVAYAVQNGYSGTDISLPQLPTTTASTVPVVCQLT